MWPNSTPQVCHIKLKPCFESAGLAKAKCGLKETVSARPHLGQMVIAVWED